MARLKPPHWPVFPRGAAFGELYARDPALAEEAAYLNYRWIGAELAALGIDVDCAPVLDLPIEGAHDVIGDRAYGRDADTVALIAEAVMRGLAEAGVMPVIKHIPGHGRSHTDSHLALPVVDTPAEVLEGSDLLPFVSLRHAPWAMTAHIVYTAYDGVLPATLSPNVIKRVIRDRIGFDGVLISDDLTMKALTGGPAITGVASLKAGCDLVLHCSGDLPEMQALLGALPAMSPEAARRIGRARAALPAPRPFTDAERLRHQTLLEQATA